MTNGEPETVVSASLQKIKSIKNPIKKNSIFYFIKSETSDSFVNHFDGHVAYLKTLDFYFNDLWKLQCQVKKESIQKEITKPRSSERKYIYNSLTPTQSCHIVMLT